MRPGANMAAAILAAALLFHAAVVLAEDAPKKPARIDGLYLEEGDSRPTLTITSLAPGVYRLLGDHWDGVGLFDRNEYLGVFRRDDRASASGTGRASGTQRARLEPDGSFTVQGEFTAGDTGSFETVWRPAPMATPPVNPGLPVPRFEHPVWPPDPPPSSDGLPKLGEYVFVEELPEAEVKVPPEYPKAALDAGIDGMVLVQALVGADGRVKDTKIVKSIPALDEAALACVRQWVFKPARAKGKPVAVWVAVPVMFTLH